MWSLLLRFGGRRLCRIETRTRERQECVRRRCWGGEWFMSFASLKTIVVATDLDGRSEAALEYARKIASAYGARIVLAHGLDPLDYASVVAVPGKILEGLPAEGRAVLEQMAAELLREGIHSHSEIRQGTVAQILVDVAKQYEAGLIVIGTEGRQ